MQAARQHEGSRGHFVFDVAEIRKGSINVSREIPLAFLAERFGHCEYEVKPTSATAEIELSVQGGGVLAAGRLTAAIATQCSVCLSDMTLHLECPVSAFLLPRPEVPDPAEEQELTPAELEEEWYDGDTIVLDGLIGDALVLELPIAPRCGGACPGLAALRKAEQPHEIDPRLAPLARLRLEKES